MLQIKKNAGKKKDSLTFNNSLWKHQLIKGQLLVINPFFNNLSVILCNMNKNIILTITAEILVFSLANFYCQ